MFFYIINRVEIFSTLKNPKFFHFEKSQVCNLCLKCFLKDFYQLTNGKPFQTYSKVLEVILDVFCLYINKIIL